MHLFVIGSHQALIDMAGRRLTAIIQQQRISGKRYCIDTGLIGGSGRDSVVQCANIVIRKVRRIEPDVLVSVVVQSVKANSEAYASNKFACSRQVVGETEPRAEVVGVLVPDVAVLLDELGALHHSGERGCRE